MVSDVAQPVPFLLQDKEPLLALYGGLDLEDEDLDTPLEQALAQACRAREALQLALAGDHLSPEVLEAARFALAVMLHGHVVHLQELHKVRGLQQPDVRQMVLVQGGLVLIVYGCIVAVPCGRDIMVHSAVAIGLEALGMLLLRCLYVAASPEPCEERRHGRRVLWSLHLLLLAVSKRAGVEVIVSQGHAPCSASEVAKPVMCAVVIAALEHEAGGVRPASQLTVRV
mmetsp:Transcript_73507/g.215632  ORF Transcript_73507/g.215632 Transcript_73507/m.215632 type:complete len:227 (+) Transcript_73507:733-1413(+)